MGRITLYGWLNFKPDLLDYIIIPEGLDRETLINEIVKSSGDLFTYHQALEPLQQNINFWFSRRSYDFERMLQALRASYSPIENYDRYEENSRSLKKSGTDSSTSNNSALSNNKLQRTETLNDSLTSTEQVSAYNAADYQNAGKTQTDKSAGSSSEDNTRSEAEANATSSTTYGSGHDEVESNHIHGNIGVTQMSELIANEINLRASYDIYKIIAQEFEKEFLIQVY